MVPLTQMVREGLSEEDVFKGATGEAKQVATAARGGEEL